MKPGTTYDDIVRRVTPLPDFTLRPTRDEAEAAEDPDRDPTPEEAEIAAAIRGQFADDPALAVCDLGVTMRGHLALVTGTVVTDDDRRRAIAITRDTPGVEAVVDEVDVKL
jgi:hypothetical protein